MTGNVQNVQIRFDAPHGTSLLSERKFQKWVTDAIRRRSDMRFITTAHKQGTVLIKFEVSAPEDVDRRQHAVAVANLLMQGCERSWPGLVAKKAALV